jgi:hypothetical protein
LQLKCIAKTKKGEKTLICVNQNGHTVELPKDCVAGFQPMADGKEYYLAEVLKKFSLPLYVRFVEPYTMDQRTRSKDKPLYQPPGTICLDRTSTRTVITATAMRNNGQQNMVQFSPDIDICLLVCEDAFRESADYVNICHSFNQDIDNQNIYTAITEYIDMTQNLKEFSLNAASKSGSKKIKKGVPPLRKPTKPKPAKVFPPRPRLGSSKAKSNRAKAIPSKPVLPKDEIEQTYTDPNEIYEEIGFTEPTYTECRFLDNSTYTELDPPNIPTNSHEYAKPDVKHPAESNPITPAILSSSSTPTSGNKQPAKSNPPSHLGSQLSATSDSNQPVESGSNSILCENRSPPPVPDRLPSRRNRSVILTNPHLPNNAVALPIRALPDNPPQLPSRCKVPDRETDVSAVQERKTAPTDSQSPRPMVTNSNPALPTSLPGQPPSLPTNIMPVPTPEQKEEIYEAISKYPTDLSSLSITDVSALLNYLGMGKYVETFEAELIDGAMLASMDKESLESLNLIPFHVTKLMKFIGGWRPNSKIRLKTSC